MNNELGMQASAVRSSAEEIRARVEKMNRSFDDFVGAIEKLVNAGICTDFGRNFLGQVQQYKAQMEQTADELSKTSVNLDNAANETENYDKSSSQYF